MNHSAHPFTCNTCQVAFRTSDLQRTHMQSDWHRYNLKRKVASLPPLASEVFAEKVLANKATAAATAARASFEKACDACAKTYYSQNAYVNHLGSQKHKLSSARLNAKAGNETESLADSTFSLGDPIEFASTTASAVAANGEEHDLQAEEEFEEIAEGLKNADLNTTADPVARRPTVPTPSKALGSQSKVDETQSDEEDAEFEHEANFAQCLFCNYISPTKELNLHHMSRQHGFFIPERDYIVDLAGLVTYLSETIHVLHQCLFCHKSVHTASGVQTHMRDRGHCMIAYSTEDEQMELGEFYDFSSTYSDDESEDEVEKGEVSLGAKRYLTYQRAQPPPHVTSTRLFHSGT
nr:cytoplasmic 60s subunit biogenesis factor rei1 like [Quercus suber]